MNAGPCSRDVVLTGEAKRGSFLSPKERTGECGCVARLGGHKALKVAAPMWGRELSASSSDPSPQLQQGRVQGLVLRPKSSPSAGPPGRPLCVCPRVCMGVEEGEDKGPLRVLVCRGACPPPPPASATAENRTLSLICTSGASKPQPRQRVVGGGATEAGCAIVCQYACLGPAWAGVGGGGAPWPSGLPCPRKVDGVEGAGSSPLGRHRVQPSDHRPGGRSSHFSHKFFLFSAAMPPTTASVCGAPQMAPHGSRHLGNNGEYHRDPCPPRANILRGDTQ